uniref:TUBGCP4 n=1 Tax=Arundo donax TaxID=35708 RepID=A0A0A9E1F7_ARUDO
MVWSTMLWLQLWEHSYWIIRRWLLSWSTNSALEGFLFKDYGSFVRE